jgi:sugar phosphate isomerase/epimerase
MGSLDWPAIIGVLKEIGYDGAVSVEFCPPLDRTPANPYPGSLDTNPVGLSPEQKKFLEDHGSSAFTEDFYTQLTQQSFDVLKGLI